MLEVKKYVWLLTELLRQKASLKILDVFFLKLESIQHSFFTASDGTLSSQNLKQFSIQELLEKYFFKKLNSNDPTDLQKPALYVCYPTYKKLTTLSELKDLLKKEQKFTSVKEIIIMQDYQHDQSTYYTSEVKFDGEGLSSKVFRKDFNLSESQWKDSKYTQLSITLTKYLVAFIETTTRKNLIRLSYDFVIDPNFTPIILCVSSIKLLSPKLVALNKGLPADVLENHIPIKTDYRTASFPLVHSVVKEPETETASPAPVTSPLSTSIFKHFILKFLRGKPPRKRTYKSSLSEQISPLPVVWDKKNEEIKASAFTSNSPAWSSQKARNPLNASEAGSFKLPEVRFLNSAKSMSGRSHMLRTFRPSQNLSKFLNEEKERIIENTLKRMSALQAENAAKPKKTAKKTRIKVKKKAKKNKSIEKLASPYTGFYVFK